MFVGFSFPVLFPQSEPIKHVNKYTIYCQKQRLCPESSQVSLVTFDCVSSDHFIRKFDYENFLATLLIKDPVIKRCALTFRAFNVELSQVLDVTSQPVAVQGRYLFWSEVVEEIYSGDVHKNVKNQPIAAEILEVSLTHSSILL